MADLDPITPKLQSTPYDDPEKVCSPTTEAAKKAAIDTEYVGGWSADRLDRAYAELSKHPAGKAPILAKVEKEIAARTVVPLSSAKEEKVELCKRDVRMPGASNVHIKHHWIRTTNKEAGIGEKKGAFPGNTSILDHKGQGDLVESTCERVDHVGQACVDKELAIGKSTGRWWPWHQCQTFVKNVLAKCGV